MKREEIIKAIAQKLTDDADTDALMKFFYDVQCDYLEELTDSDIEELALENEIIEESSQFVKNKSDSIP